MSPESGSWESASGQRGLSAGVIDMKFRCLCRHGLRRWPGLLIPDVKALFKHVPPSVSGKKMMETQPTLWDLEARFQIMDRYDGYTQVISLTGLPIESVAKGKDAVELAMISNDEPPYGLIGEVAPGNEYPDKYMIPETTNVLRSGRPVLAYATLPLVTEVRVWGPLSTVLYGSSTTLDTLWFVRLGDVSPEGSVTMLTSGQLRASFREVDEGRSKPGQPFHPFQNSVNLDPNTVYEFQIEMMPIFHTFKVGHKIWVQIASDDLSFHSPAITDIHTMPMPAGNSVYHDLTHPSHVLLPTIPDSPEIKPVEPPVSQIAWPTMLDDFYRTTRRLMM